MSMDFDSNPRISNKLSRDWISLGWQVCLKAHLGLSEVAFIKYCSHVTSGLYEDTVLWCGLIKPVTYQCYVGTPAVEDFGWLRESDSISSNV